MHTCPPPKKVLNFWLEDVYSEVDGYGHLLLEQKAVLGDKEISQLRTYFESAHLDARQHFHNIMRISLHPDAIRDTGVPTYPNSLPIKAQHGLFGEALAGLLTETYKFIGKHTWTIPVFLFRHHQAVEMYLFALSRDEARKGEVFGRLGSDFLALRISPDGSVEGFIAGEAKWRNSLTPGVADTLMLGKKIEDPDGGPNKVHSGKGIWYELNRDTKVPHGLTQLQNILLTIAPEEYAETIVSLDRALALNNPDHIDRTDLVVLAGNGGKTRNTMTCLVGWEEVPEEYLAGNDLQVVELILTKGDELIDQLYSDLWLVEGEE